MFDAIPGQARAKALFARALAGDGLSHAYLLAGPEGLGKLEFAREVGVAMVAPCGGCGACADCERARRGAHPDLRVIEREGELIRIEQVAELVAELALKPFAADRRVWVIPEAEQLTPPAANKLLKSIEEPPAHVHFLLVTDRIDRACRPSTVIQTAQPMKTDADARNMVLRMKAIPAYFASRLANLREGLREGRIAARVPVEKTVAQLEELLKTPADKMPRNADAARKLPADLQAQYLPEVLAAVDTHVKPPLAELARFLKEDYLPKARAEKIGLSDSPGGEDAYLYMIAYHTTLPMGPAEVREIGLSQLKDIRAEMAAVAKKLRHKGDLKSFLDKVRQEPKNFFKTREEVQKDAEFLVGGT